MPPACPLPFGTSCLARALPPRLFVVHLAPHARFSLTLPPYLPLFVVLLYALLPACPGGPAVVAVLPDLVRGLIAVLVIVAICGRYWCVCRSGVLSCLIWFPFTRPLLATPVGLPLHYLMTFTFPSPANLPAPTLCATPGFTPGWLVRSLFGPPPLPHAWLNLCQRAVDIPAVTL